MRDQRIWPRGITVTTIANVHPLSPLRAATWMPQEAILVSAAFTVLEAGLWPNAGQQPFVRAVVVVAVEEEPLPWGENVSAIA
jgi:hypothetical protein